MGDLPFFAPPATTTTTPSTAAAGRAVPRCRRVHFRDVVASPVWLPPSPLPVPADNDDDHATAQKEEEAEQLEMAGRPDRSEDEDRMDLLWEDFNEELLAMRRACACSSTGGPHRHELWPSGSSSDGDDSDSAAGRAGCFPVLRPSARAGGAGHYRRRHAGTWVLLMRIFSRLFVVDKTAISARRRHAIVGSAR